VPALGGELRIADHVATLHDVIQQSIGGPAFLPAQRGPPRQQLFASRFVAVVLEGVQQRVDPGVARGVLFAERRPATAMHVLAEVIEVQSQPVQLQRGLLKLRRNPTAAANRNRLYPTRG